MFKSKGPLSKIWLAAHFHRKITKSQVNTTDIRKSCRVIEDPATPLALRLSGQLLLGVVRIYSKKVLYLFEDCNEALSKMKSVSRPSRVDLPSDAAVAPTNLITIPDYSLTLMPDVDFNDLLADEPLRFANISRMDDITILQGQVEMEEKKLEEITLVHLEQEQELKGKQQQQEEEEEKEEEEDEDKKEKRKTTKERKQLEEGKEEKKR